MRLKKLKLLSTLGILALLFGCADNPQKSDNSSILSSNNSFSVESSSSSNSSHPTSSSGQNSSSENETSSSSSQTSSSEETSSSLTNPIFGVTQEVTAVYAQVPTDWDNIHIHYWNAEDESAIEEGYTSNWPGEKMTLVSSDEHLYGFKIPKGVANIIINNGGSKQTIDLNYSTNKNLIVVDNEAIDNEYSEDNGKYNVKYNSYVTKPTDPTLGEKEYSPISYIKMYFSVPSSWASPNIYYFGTAAPGAHDWPGTALTKVEDKENVFTFEKLPTDITAFIINNNNGSQQTSDLDLYTDLDYSINGYEVIQESASIKASPQTYNSETGVFSPVTISEANYYIRGSEKANWGVKPEFRLRHDKESNSASITVSFKVNEEFKVAEEDWNHKNFGSSYIPEGNEDFEGSDNIKVKNACTYKITINNISSDESQRTISFEKIS